MTVPPPAVAASEQVVPQVDAPPAPSAQPSEQVQSVPALTSTPPPYSPPAYTPKQQKISRSQKIIMFVTGGVVALIMLILIIVAFGGEPSASPAPTGSPVPAVTSSSPASPPAMTLTKLPPTATLYRWLFQVHYLRHQAFSNLDAICQENRRRLVIGIYQN
jgi:hypothetical protein